MATMGDAQTDTRLDSMAQASGVAAASGAHVTGACASARSSCMHVLAAEAGALGPVNGTEVTRSLPGFSGAHSP